MGVLVRQFAEMREVLSRRATAPSQAGVFSGDNPSAYNTTDPFRLWVIQVIVIMGMIQLLAFFLSRIRQPRVIAEVIGGVVLGPSVMGRIPNFTNTIFPAPSLPFINLTSTIGLVLFLFLVGLEIDVKIIRRNLKASMLISATGLVIPLGLGAALGVPIYHQFVDPSVNFGYFLLFTAVAIGITAFPVLCRILTELKLLEDTVGVVVLAAGVGNDVVGWVLLALTVALVNAGSGLTALWVLLTAVGYVLFLLIPVRWAFRWLARRTGCLETGQPTALMMTITLVLVFISAFFTDIIGIHAIFGGFIAGLIIPHDNGFAISLVEKLEDLVTLLFLPLYFVFSGLKTNLGLLDNGITWGYTILICVVAFFSKFLGCAVVAKLSGFTYRESGAIGSLMSCKGLVELIVLNVGLSAGILDTRTFSMFVLHALVLTFMTTPLTLLFYPAKYRTRATAVVKPGTAIEAGQSSLFRDTFKHRFAVIVDRIEQLPALMTLTQLLQPSSTDSASASKVSVTSSANEKQTLPATPPGLAYVTSSSTPVSMEVLRLIELTDRTSAVLKSQSADSLVQRDPILAIFRTFGNLNRLVVSTALAVVGHEEFAPYIADFAQRTSSDLVILPWSSNAGSTDDTPTESIAVSSAITTTFDSLFAQIRSGPQNESLAQVQFFRKMFMAATTDVALYIDGGLSHPTDTSSSTHIFLPFFGGPDDRLALAFVVQLCMNPVVSATVVRFSKVDDSVALTPVSTIEEVKKVPNLQDTVYALGDTQTRLASESADNLLWDQYTMAPGSSRFTNALSRIAFKTQRSSLPLHDVLSTTAEVGSQSTHSRLLVVTGRSRRLAVESHAVELQQVLTEKNAHLGSETTKALGDVGSALVASTANVSLLVVQAFLS